MKRCGLILALVASPAVAGNFCAVTGSGANCSFPDAASCYQHIQGVGGQCVPNPQAISQPPMPADATSRSQVYDVNAAVQKPDYVGAAQQGIAFGQQQRMQREEHEARMALLRAETEAAKAQAPQDVAEGQLGRVGDPDGRDLAEVTTNGAALNRACGYAQAMRGPAGQKLNADEAMLAVACTIFAKGVLTTAWLAGDFSSQDGSVHFCAPRSGTTTATLSDAIVSTARSAPELVLQGASTEPLLLVALASLSSCQPQVKP